MLLNHYIRYDLSNANDQRTGPSMFVLSVSNDIENGFELLLIYSNKIPQKIVQCLLYSERTPCRDVVEGVIFQISSIV